MDVLPQVISASVIVLVSVVLNWTIRDKFREQNRYMDARFDGIDARFDGVDQRFVAVDQRFDGVDQRFDRVEARIDRVEDRLEALRSDVTQIALALGTRTRPETG
jgi:archaellum component FlaC